jgi:hypothetical protein
MLGLVTVNRLTALGLSRQQRRTLVANRVLVPVAPKVLRHAAWPATWQQSVLAAVLAAGDSAVASHFSAAALWRFDGINPGSIEVTVLPTHNPRAVPGIVHRSRDLGAADVERRRLIPRTTPARTLMDIASRVSAAELEQVLDGAERDGLVWRPHLRWRLEQLRRHGREGVPQLTSLLDRTEGRPLGEGWLEQEALRLIQHAGLPVPRCQVHLRKARGGVTRVDLMWEEARLIVELDGHGTHATRRQRQADAERSARLMLAGWRVVRFTYEDVVERPDYVIQTLRKYLQVVRT